MTRAPEPTPAQRAAIDAATWRPVTRDEGVEVVSRGALRADLDGYELPDGRAASAGGLYRVHDRYPATTWRLIAVLVLDEAAGQRWYAAEVAPC